MSNGARSKLACTECTKRKIKCDKEIPCENCHKRGQASGCRRRDIELNGRPFNAGITEDGPSNELTTRVAALENTLTRLTSAVEKLASGQTVPETLIATSVVSEAADDDEGTDDFSESDAVEVENASTVIEFLAWGRRKSTYRHDTFEESLTKENAIQDFNELDQAQFRRIAQVLPQRQMVEKVVGYYCERLIWYDGAIYEPSFRKRLAKFYGNDASSDMASRIAAQPQFVALVFAVLSSGFACASEHTIGEWALNLETVTTLAQEMFHSANTCLELGGYLAKPSLYSIQCIAALTLPGHILGHSTKQSILLAIAIRLAQTLNLHQLGKELEDQGPAVASRETCRRVWCQLATQDFFQTPFSETNNICLATTTTDKPRNCHDNEFKTLPDTTPTQTSFIRFKYDMALLLPRLQLALSKATTSYAQYEQILLFDTEMRKLVTENRPPFLSPGPVNPSWPRWTPWARRALRISCAHKVIMIHRKFASLSFTNDAFAFTRRTCIAASKTILKCQKDEVDPQGPILWIEHASVVTACVILSFDLLYQTRDSGEWQETYGDIADAIVLLGRATRSKIASRGVRLLTTLLQQVEKSSRNQNVHRKRARHKHGTPSAKRQRFNTASFVDNFLRDENAHSSNGVIPTTQSTQTDDMLDLFARNNGEEMIPDDSLDIPWDMFDTASNKGLLAAIAGDFSPGFLSGFGDMLTPS